MEYKIYAALHEESNNGWVWFAKPEFEPRTLVLLSNSQTGQCVYCECRRIDENFRKLYNDRPYTVKVSGEDQDVALVISDWYRRALGIKTTKIDVDLRVSKANWWGELRTGCQHPDPVVRLATRLGILASLLGFSAFFFALSSVVSQKLNPIAAVLSVVLGIVSLFACRGVKSPRAN